MSFDSAPSDASVKNLLELCEVLREGDLSREELYDAADQGESLVRDNIRFGVGLGFLEESEEGVSATSRGIEASYNREDPGLAEQFQEGFKDYDLYNVVLKEIVTEDDGEKDEIAKSDVLQVFRTSVGLEGSENTLGSAATTFIQTLGAAELGDYIIGRGGNETRLEKYEEFESLVEKIIKDGEKKEELNQKVEQDADFTEQSIKTNKSVSEPGVGGSFRIRLELSCDDDPKEIEELIVGVRRGFAREINLSNSNDDSNEIPSQTGPPQTHARKGSDYEKRENDNQTNDEKEVVDSDQSLNTFIEPESDTGED